MKDYTIVVNKTPDGTQRFALYLGQKIEMHKPTNPNTDLVINVSKLAKDRDGKAVLKNCQKIYFFAPDEITVVEFGVNDIKVDFTNFDQVMRGVEQMTQEIYHPGKSDLTNLLSNLSSAKSFGS